MPQSVNMEAGKVLQVFSLNVCRVVKVLDESPLFLALLVHVLALGPCYIYLHSVSSGASWMIVLALAVGGLISGGLFVALWAWFRQRLSQQQSDRFGRS